MAMAKSRQIQEKVWTEAVAATRLLDSHASSGLLLLPALNAAVALKSGRVGYRSHYPVALGRSFFEIEGTRLRC